MGSRDERIDLAGHGHSEIANRGNHDKLARDKDTGPAGLIVTVNYILPGGRNMCSRRGAILIIIMIFMVIVAITSLGLYNYIYNLFKAQGMVEVERIRGYYAAFGGLHYARVLLRDPVGNLGFEATIDPLNLKTATR